MKTIQKDSLSPQLFNPLAVALVLGLTIGLWLVVIDSFTFNPQWLNALFTILFTAILLSLLRYKNKADSQTLDALRQRTRQFQAIMDNASAVAIFINDLDSRCLMMNEPFQRRVEEVGLVHGSVIGMSFLDLRKRSDISIRAKCAASIP